MCKYESMRDVGGQVDSVCCQFYVVVGANLCSLMQDNNTKTETRGFQSFTW